MRSIKKVIAVWKYQTIFQTYNSKTLIVLLMLFLYIRCYTEPIMNFAREYDVNISPYLFPYFMNDWVIPLIISLGFLVLICDVPYIKKGYLFLVARTGKICWAIGQTLFLLTYSILYTITIYSFTVINTIPRIEWNSEWGKAIMTLVRTDASIEFQTLSLSTRIAENYTAPDALLKTILLCALLFWFIGMAVFVFNYLFKNHLGVFIGVVVIFLDLAVYNLFDPIFYKYSPVSLTKLSLIDGSELWSPTFAYAFGTMLLCSVLFLFVIILSLRIKRGIVLNDRRES